MIQLNLLPDVKLEYIKTKRTKRLVLTASIVVIGVSIALFVFMFLFVMGVQKKHISNLDKDIDSGVSTIQNTPGINEILTVQNQLSVLNGKHDDKPAAIRILPFIAQLLPTGSKVTDLSVDFEAGTMTISGTTTDINATNKFVDTLKFAEYKTASGVTGKPYSEVVLVSYSTALGSSAFEITSKFDPLIFDNEGDVVLSVPGIVSTRSSTEKPNLQFSPETQPPESGGN